MAIASRERRVDFASVQATRQQAGLLAEYTERLHRLPSLHTRRAYLRVARNFLQTFPDVPLELVTAEHIERYLDSRGLSPASYHTDLENLRAFFKWLRERKRLIRSNPCEGVEPPKRPIRLRRAPTWDEFCAIRAQCQNIEEATVVETFYFTGLRIAEFLSVKTDDVDLARRRIRVLGKGQKERIVMFPERVGRLLQEHIGTRQGCVFCGPAGRRTQRFVNRTLRRFGQEAGLPYRLTARILRHGWARLMKTRGVPIEVTAKLAGHSSIKTTAHWYGQMDEDDLQAAYDRHLGEFTGS